MYVPSARNSSYSFRPILFKLYRFFEDGLKICILFFQNPEIIFYYIFCIFNLGFFWALIVQKCTVYAQLLLHFQADPFETLHMLLGWSEDMHIVFFQNPEIIFYHFLLHF